MSSTEFASPAAELAYIRSTAQGLGLDPGAVLAVAKHEGVTLPSQPGDNNTSFGPWQLHFGGRYPSSGAPQDAKGAQAWANSPQGIGYALAGIAQVAKGQTGAAAINSIVRQFEQPRADLVDAEVRNSVASYQAGETPGAPGSFSQLVNAGGQGSPLGGFPGGGTIQSAANTVTGGISGVESALKFLFSARFLEIAGGGILVVVALVGLMREVGFSVPVPLAAAASAAPGPIADAPRRQQRKAGFTLAADRKPRRGDPGSSMLASDDALPF